METLHSTELSSELAFFEEDYINDAIMSKSLEPKHPVTNIGENTSSPIDFNIDGTERAIRPSQSGMVRKKVRLRFLAGAVLLYNSY